MRPRLFGPRKFRQPGDAGVPGRGFNEAAAVWAAEVPALGVTEWCDVESFNEAAAVWAAEAQQGMGS